MRRSPTQVLTRASDKGHQQRVVGVCSEQVRHQQGWLVCAANKYFNQERTAPVSVLYWRSRKLTRKARRPQLVETHAASSAAR